MSQIRRKHNFDVVEGSVTDPETLKLVYEMKTVHESMYQSTSLIGTWLENRVGWLLDIWLNQDYCLSQAQILDEQRLEFQSRSWDIVIHHAPSSADGLPINSHGRHGYPLLPKRLCRMAIDTKARYNTPGEYAMLGAFRITGEDQSFRQLDLLLPEVKPVLFVLASTYKPETLVEAGKAKGLSVFVLIKATVNKPSDGAVNVKWELNPGLEGVPPLQAFKKLVLEAVGKS